MDGIAVDKLLAHYRNLNYYPSADCVIFNNERVLSTHSVGEFTHDSLFDIASVSKLICSSLILFSLEEGRLKLTDRVLDIFPKNSFHDISKTRLEQVTLEKLLTHTSGLLPWYPFYSENDGFFSVFEKALRTSEVQEGFAYSDLNFMLLGRIFTEVSGMSLPEGLETYIKAPLGIKDMYYGSCEPSLCVPSSTGNQVEKRMCAERGISFDGWREDGVAVCGDVNDGNAHYYFNGVSGHAGIFSTSAELARLGMFFLNTDLPYFKLAMDTNILGRGLGFDRSDVFPDGCGHTGFTGTSLWVSREHNIGAVLLTNKFYRFDDKLNTNTHDVRRALHYGLLGRDVPTISV